MYTANFTVRIESLPIVSDEKGKVIYNIRVILIDKLYTKYRGYLSITPLIFPPRASSAVSG